VWMYYSLNTDLDPFLQAELALIINRLGGSETARSDRQRLDGYLQQKQRCR
jgi:hypothetical protein